MTIEIETNKGSFKIEPYCCEAKAMVRNSTKLVTVGHIPREISKHVYFFLKEKGGIKKGFVFFTKYGFSPIPAGGLEIPLMLSFFDDEDVEEDYRKVIRLKESHHVLRTMRLS